MKRLFTLLALVLSISVINAQETFHFRTDHPQGYSIESSTSTGLSLHYSLSEIGITDIDNGEAKGHEIILKGSFGSFAEGLPNLPSENRYIAVPNGATVSIEVKEQGCQTLNDIEVLPAAAVQGNAAVGMPKMQKNMNVFGKDAYFPTENVAIAQTTQIRGLDVVMLSVTPFRYNPVRKTLEVIYDMDIEVRFEGGGQFGEARYRNPAWNNILRDLVINNDMLPEAHYYDLLNEAVKNREEGCEYLIISPDDEDILAYADTLKQFRTRQGILTKVVTTTECGGNDANVIKGYIKNAYDNWTIPPAAVMIFSGIDTLEVGNNLYYASSGIPGFGLVFKGYDNGYYIQDFHYSSDNPYADMNGDSIPDLALSRLPATNLQEYRTQVNKLIQYETEPPTRPDYYDQPIITSSYENNKWFLITSQSVNGFYRNKLGRHPKNFYMLYEYMNDELQPPDTAWSTGFNTDAVVDYFGPNGQNYIAQQPDTLNNWHDMDDYSYLVGALNHGSFLTLYRDHSSYDLWCSPWMYSSEIKNLTNTEPTFVLSIGCDAALYSNVIYYELFINEFSEHYWSMGWDPMIYEFCKANVGALGGIGATVVTHSHFNDILTWGFLDNFWPNFMPDLGTTTQPEFTRPAYALVAGKLFLNQHAFMPNWWPQKVTTTQNVFHYLGETYLNLYTDVPQHIAVDASPYHANNQWQYNFTAEEGALVCLSYNGEIIQVTQATGQPQSFTLPEMAVGAHFFVTFTKQNCFRHELDVEVVSADSPFVYLKATSFDDQDGNGQLDFGEYATFDVTLHNISQVATESGEITLYSESPYIEIVEGASQYPQMEAEATITLENAFKIKLDEAIPDQTELPFKVRIRQNGNTHEDDFSLTANAPVIKIDPDFRITIDDGEPSTHISTESKSSITFTFSNIGHSTISLLSADLDVKAPFVEVETPPYLYEGLEPNSELALTYELNTLPNTLTGAWLQSRLDIQYGACFTRLDTIIQYGGVFENFESETLNPLFQWATSGNHSWVFCDDDAYQGNRCFTSRADTVIQSRLVGRLKVPTVMHKCKISFRYKTDDDEVLQFSMGEKGTNLSSKDWQYADFKSKNAQGNFILIYKPINSNSRQAKIDDLCFPPAHTTIAYAGDDLIACEASSIELNRAYAYDCNSLVWTTEGDGHFDCDTIANPTYFPGSQDLANGSVMLTLSAFGNDTIVSSTQIRFVDEISLSTIIGDTVVNKYTNPVSHYSVESLEGIHYLWQIEPAETGFIYEHGHEIDILWNLHEGDAEVTLTVATETGCEVEAITKTISLIGYSTSEWHSTDFDLFPNPTDGTVHLVIGETLQDKAIVEVYNLLGERMMAKNVHTLQKGEALNLDLSHLVSGLYIIKLSTENGSCSKKVSVR